MYRVVMRFEPTGLGQPIYIPATEYDVDAVTYEAEVFSHVDADVVVAPPSLRYTEDLTLGTFGSVQIVGGELRWRQPRIRVIEAANNPTPPIIARLQALGFTDVTFDLTTTTVAQVAGYDVVVADDTAWGLSNVTLFNAVYAAGHSILTSGNDTNSGAPVTGSFPGGKGSGNPAYRLEPTGSHIVAQGWIAEDRELDTGQLITALRASATPIANMPWGVVNLLTTPQATMNPSITGWTPGNNTQALTRVSGIAASQSGWVLGVPAAAAGNTAAYMTYANSVAVTPGQSVLAQAEFRAATIARNVSVELRFYLSADGTVFTDVLGIASLDSTTGWTQKNVIGVAPAGALRVGIINRIAGNGAAGELHYVQKVGLSISTTMKGWLAPGINPTTGITSFVEENPADWYSRWFHLQPWSSAGNYALTTSWMKLLKRGVAWATPSWRRSPSRDLSTIKRVGSSRISWEQTNPGESSVLVETSVDGGVTWQVATSGQPVPGLTYDVDVVGKTLECRQRLQALDPTQTPTLRNLMVEVSPTADAFPRFLGTPADVSYDRSVIVEVGVKV